MSNNKDRNLFELVPDKGVLKGLKPAQKQELLAVQQWIRENNPDSQELAELCKRDDRLERLIVKSRQKGKTYSRYQRQRDL